MNAGRRFARRALRRWSWRLFRREWRQQVLVVALITVAVAASVYGATAAYNLTPSRAAEFGSANHRFENAVARPEDIAPYIAEAEAWFGTIEVIGHQAVPIPGTTAIVELRSVEPDGPFSGAMVAVLDGRRPTSVDEIALTDGAAADLDAGARRPRRSRPQQLRGRRASSRTPPTSTTSTPSCCPPARPPSRSPCSSTPTAIDADRFRPSVMPGQGFIESRR